MTEEEIEVVAEELAKIGGVSWYSGREKGSLVRVVCDRYRERARLAIEALERCRAIRDAALIQVGGPQPAAFSPDLLKSPDYAQLLEAHAEIAALHKGPSTVIDAGGKETEVTTLDALLRLIMEQAKDGATLQRYKGLGEMNPEQLWETTMNPETRTLLKVTMEDAVGADEMFTVLMGDAVEPRREFIEKNALDVINLDV